MMKVTVIVTKLILIVIQHVFCIDSVYDNDDHE